MDAKIIERFISSIQKTEGCWTWTKSLNTQGYGIFSVKGKNVRAHRFSYEYFTGNKIPSRKQIDHICNNKSCVNPEHLACVSLYENIMRGTCVSAVNAKKTECVRGHSLLGSNLHYQKGRNGRFWRKCKKCDVIRSSEYRRRKKTSP